MSLQAMTLARVSPSRMKDFLQRHFDAVDVVEANRDGWFELLCWQGAGEDSRLRLRVRFIFSTAMGGWTYRILPGYRA